MLLLCLLHVSADSDEENFLWKLPAVVEASKQARRATTLHHLSDLEVLEASDDDVSDEDTPIQPVCLI